MGLTTIQWTDRSINPIRARLKVKPPGMKACGVGHYCEKVSPGCTICYSSETQPRYGMPKFEAPHRDDVEVFFDPRKLGQVLALRAPSKWFWCDMTDIFGRWVSDDWLDIMFATMIVAVRGTHQVLTKRADRMHAYMTRMRTRTEGRYLVPALLGHAACIARDMGDEKLRNRFNFEANQRAGVDTWPPPNVWLGVSAENQDAWDERVEVLGRTPAAVRFVSAEPLLGEIDCGNAFDDPTDGSAYGRIDQVIVGGESAKKRLKARPCDVAWIRSIVRQAQVAGAAAYVKQLGARPYRLCDLCSDHPGFCRMFGGKGGHDEHRCLYLHLRDRKGGDMSEWPEDLRGVREFPSEKGVRA